MITKNDLKKNLEKLLRNVAPGDMQAITQKMGEHLAYSAQHYDELDDEAKNATDGSIEAIKQYNAQLLSQIPDSKFKRQLARLHASSTGKHFDIEAHIKELESSSQKIDPDLSECVRIFTEGLKHISGFIFDITQDSMKGSANYAQISLLMLCVNELLVTLHLLKHRYANQAYSHIRTIFELLDKVELFRVKPKWADVWASNDEKLIWNELRPAEVRKKLGKNKYDPIYALFSSLGVHGSFQAVQVQSARKVQAKKDNISITFWVGGTPFEHNIVWVNAFAIYALYSVLMQVMRSFEKRLNAEEGEEVLKKIFIELKSYVLNQFLPWAKKAKLSTGDFEDFLKKKTWGKIVENK
jgi:hypothetical protein